MDFPFCPYSVAFSDYTLEEHTAMLNLGFICASGRTALDSTIGASSLFVAGTADLKAALQFLMSFVCLVAGTALSLLASVFLHSKCDVFLMEFV